MFALRRTFERVLVRFCKLRCNLYLLGIYCVIKRILLEFKTHATKDCLQRVAFPCRYSNPITRETHLSKRRIKKRNYFAFKIKKMCMNDDVKYEWEASKQCRGVEDHFLAWEFPMRRTKQRNYCKGEEAQKARANKRENQALGYIWMVVVGNN